MRSYTLLLLLICLSVPGFTQTWGGSDNYEGPEMLGRSGPGTGMLGLTAIPISFRASVNGSYDSSILGYSINSDGQFQPRTAYGVDLGAGLFGRKNWRRSYVGVNFGANYSHYGGGSFFNGFNQQLDLSAGTMLGRKWQLVSQIGAGTSNRFLGGPTVFQASEFEFLAAPTAELFDSRAYFFGNTTSAIYNISRRQSVRFSGNMSTVRRRARGLVDMKSYGASGDWMTRLSRRSSIGVSYTFTHYDFEKVFGETDAHIVGLHFSRSFGRAWSLSLALTGASQSTVGVRTVALDPVLSQILGRPTGAEVFETNNLTYGYTGSIARNFRRSTLGVTAQRAIVPGNGYFLTSISQGFSVYANHTLTRELALTGTFGYNKMVSLGFASGDFKGWSGGGGLTYRILDSLSLNGRVDWRTFDLQQTTFGRSGYRATIGLSFYPSGSIATWF